MGARDEVEDEAASGVNSSGVAKHDADAECTDKTTMASCYDEKAKKWLKDQTDRKKKHLAKMAKKTVW